MSSTRTSNREPTPVAGIEPAKKVEEGDNLEALFDREENTPLAVTIGGANI